MGDHVALGAAGVVEVELLQRLSGREPGGPDRPSPPCDSRAETSRCKATKYSSCVQDSARARAASLRTDSREVGAFNALVRNMISLVRSPRLVRGSSRSGGGHQATPPSVSRPSAVS